MCVILGAMAWIEAEIERRGGEVDFRDFMDLALYHPEHGYYARSTPRWGRSGDFLTAPTASTWYAGTMVALVKGIARGIGTVELVDLASGDGTFLETVLTELTQKESSAVESVVSVEKTREGRERQMQCLSRFEASVGRLQIVARLADVETSRRPRLVHASELYDAFPVHRVVARKGELRELCVRLEREGLGWIERESPSALAGYLERHGVSLVDDQIAEINLDAEQFHRDVLRRSGGNAAALVLDYGYPANRLYDPRGRVGGSLACYSRHQLSRDPLVQVGEQDITAHVNWDDLRMAGTEDGWSTLGLWSLTEFLGRAGIAEIVEREGLGLEAELDAETLSRRQELKRILDPDGMGADLKVLVQGVGETGTIVEEILSRSPFDQ